MFSNFKLTDVTSINLYLAGTTAAVQPLIDAVWALDRSDDVSSLLALTRP